MRGFIGLCLGILLLSDLTSCKKGTSTDPPEPAIVFPAYSDLPYDTSALHGVFSANLLFDSTASVRQSNLYFTAWFTDKVTQGFRDSLEVHANARTLTPYGNYFATATGLYTPAAGFIPDTSIAWSIDGGPGNAFTYTNIDSFPVYRTGIPDTIAKGRNNTFTFDGSSVANADKVLLKVLVANAPPVQFVINPPGSITLDESFIASLANKRIGVTVSVFNREPLAFNGKNYLFVREYTLGRSVWFK